MALKTCSLCHIEKPLSEFPSNGYNHKGEKRLRANCQWCDTRRKQLSDTTIGRARKRRVEPKPVIKPSIKPPKVGKRYVITYAQNATPVHKGFLETLQTYCKAQSAELIVIAGRYHNPTSVWSINAEHHEWWDDSIVPYLRAGRFELGSYRVYADISITPTAETPTSGFDGFVGNANGVLGHPKVSRRPIPSANRVARTLATTGAITVPNYISSKAGAKGLHHHVVGALILEVSEKATHIRHVHYDNGTGGFYDLDSLYTPTKVIKKQPVKVITFGDIHAYQMKPDIEEAVWGKKGIVNRLAPEYHIFHDVYDNWAVNHHDRPRERYAKINRDQDKVIDELKLTIDWLDKHAPKNAKGYVVASNHDEGLDRWLDSTHPLADMRNARTWINLWKDRIDAWERDGHWSSAFSLAYKTMGDGHLNFIKRDEELLIDDVIHHFHGDKGINGARASVQGYARVGKKVTIGHRHSPEIRDGLYCVGVMGDLDMGYNFLPSTWQQTLSVQYMNGHRALIDIISGEWHA